MANLRRVSQILFLVFFLFLFIAAEFAYEREIGLPLKIFLQLDPLVAISSILASRSFQISFLLSLVTIVLTVFLGRVFCGWFCPLGTLNNFFGYLGNLFRREKVSGEKYAKLLAVKYYILVFLIVCAVFGLNLAGLIDPIPLLVRSMTVGIDPGLNKAADSFFQAVYSFGIPGISGAFDSFHRSLSGTLLPFIRPVFRLSIVTGLIFIIILLLNLAAPRFWCRYLCPLGAFLGLIGKKQFVARVEVNGNKCVSCGKCNEVCQGEATPYPPGRWASRECLECFNCEEVCPVKAVKIAPSSKRQGDGDVDLKRRWVLAGALGAVVSASALGTSRYVGRPHPERIRPPGALPEEQFLEKCVKCGECLKVCITGGLQPALHQAGLEGLYTPILVPKFGYCEYSCNQCSQVCPTGAIRNLTLEEKQGLRIGLAAFDKNRCLPHASGINCGVCEEHCPAPGKAIKFRDEKITQADGYSFILKKPYVEPHLCIGCGICENKCPITDLAGVRVSGINESRGENRLFL